jgi:hypothetical protein
MQNESKFIYMWWGGLNLLATQRESRYDPRRKLDSTKGGNMIQECESWWDVDTFEEAEISCIEPATKRALMPIGLVSTGEVLVPVLACVHHSMIGDLDA